MLRFLFVFSVPTFSSYNPDIAKKGASSRGVTPLRWRARGPNQGGVVNYWVETRLANAPTRSRSVRMQAQRLLVNLR